MYLSLALIGRASVITRELRIIISGLKESRKVIIRDSETQTDGGDRLFHLRVKPALKRIRDIVQRVTQLTT